MSLWRIILRETRLLLRGRISRAMILAGLPLLFTLLFGLVYDENVVNNIDTVVYDQSQSSLSRTLIQMYDDSERFHLVSYVDSEEKLREEIYTGRARVALMIPESFSGDIKSGQGSKILLTVNSANNMFANGAMSSAQEINRSFSVAVGQKMLEAAGLLPGAAMAAVYPLRLGVRILGNPVNGYSQFMLTGLMLNGLQIGIMITLGTYLYDELARGRRRSARGLLLTLGRAVPYGCFAMLGYLLSLLLAVYGFAIPMAGNVADACLLGGAYIFFVMGAISIFSACAPNRPMALQSPMLYIMPGLLYSGLSWPSFEMEGAVGIFSLLLPISYAGDCLRDIMLMGYAPELWDNVLRMLLFGSGCFAIAVLVMALRQRKLQGGEAVHG
ncbi:ABC transporter permease [Anaerovibrio sp.]|uniref:ABC transporter permease n=1 Tax=Anaerovibrio sp. TaxID=1872532 RepID=UPI003F17AF9F